MTNQPRPAMPYPHTHDTYTNTEYLIHIHMTHTHDQPTPTRDAFIFPPRLSTTTDLSLTAPHAAVAVRLRRW
jgi:hypothetical protein